YVGAMELAPIFRSRGFTVKCVLRSTMEGAFEGLEGAALYRTDRGRLRGTVSAEAADFCRHDCDRRAAERPVYILVSRYATAVARQSRGQPAPDLLSLACQPLLGYPG